MISPDPSMAEVFADADAVNPELQRLSKKWIERTGACNEFHRVPVKNSSRALQKVYRSYNEDPGRLCDLVRCSLVFVDIESMLQAFQFIRDDPDVELQHAKKTKMRFRPDYDDSSQADIATCS